MENQEKGECSRRRSISEDEKPLKKARYVWEVKGKYHLKETYKNNNTSENNVENRVKDDVEENIVDKSENHNNSEKCTRKCCIETFLATLSPSISDMDSEDDEKLSKNIEQSISNDIPVTLVSPNPKSQDYYLRKWQARQIVRGFVDNTLNSLLEKFLVPPFDAADLIENCENDRQIQDESILMAIQSHGLQANLRGNIQVPQPYEDDAYLVNQPELSESSLHNFENYQNELRNRDLENYNSNSDLENYNCNEMSSSNLDNEEIIDEDMKKDRSLELEDPMDFLNAAVSAAIQKKGLPSYGY